MSSGLGEWAQELGWGLPRAGGRGCGSQFCFTTVSYPPEVAKVPTGYGNFAHYTHCDSKFLGGL